MKNTARLSKTISASLAIFILLTLIFAVSLFAVSNDGVAYAAEKKYLFIPYTGDLKTLSSSQPSGYFFNVIGQSFKINLPSTYYVEIIEEENARYKCLYHGIQGYVDKHENLQVQSMASAITEYPTLTLKTKNSTIEIDYISYTSSDYDFYYLGGVKDSSTDIVVLMQLKSGGTQELKSISVGEFESFTVPLHPITEKAKQDAIGSGGADGTLNPEGTVSNPALRALLIAGIVVPALILVIMIFIPRKKKDNYDRFVQRRGGSPYDEPKQPYMSNANSRYRRGGDDRYDYRDGQGYYPDDRDYNSRGYRDARDADYSGDQKYNYDDRRANDYYPDDYDRRDRRYR